MRTLDLVTTGSDYFIVAEYVRSGNLQTLLKQARRRQRHFSADSMVFIGRQILAALSYAHRRREQDGRPYGVIHRDVSPSNILISDRGSVKLSDFGIAKAQDQRSVVFKVKGKVGYMSPEQARGTVVDLARIFFRSASCCTKFSSANGCSSAICCHRCR